MLESEIDKSVFKVWKEEVITRKLLKYISNELDCIKNCLLYSNSFDSGLYGYNRGAMDICERILNIDFEEIEDVELNK